MVWQFFYQQCGVLILFVPSSVDTKEDNLPTSAMVPPATGPEVGLALPEGRGLFQHLYHTLKPPQ